MFLGQIETHTGKRHVEEFPEMIRHGGNVCCIFAIFQSPSHVYSERDMSAVAAGVISLFADSINFRTACVRFIERAFRPLARARNVPFRIGCRGWRSILQMISRR